MTNSTKKPANRLAGRAIGNNASGGTPPAAPRGDDYRAIKEVIDTTLPAGQQLRTVQNVADALTQVGVTNLRTELGIARAAGSSRFLCATCGEPVHMAQRPPGPDVPKDGRAAYFKHYANRDAPPCTCRTPHSAHDVGAVKFAGLQEGLDHETLKHQLAECLSADPRFTDVQTERRVTAKDGSWRIPDVSAMFEGQLVAFDLQIATLPIATILARGSFYAANGVKHVWLTDAADLSRLTQQAFIDLHLNSGGRIFAISDASLAVSLRSKTFHLSELSILPRLAPELALHNVWRRDLVDSSVIFMNPVQRAMEGQRRYREALTVQATTLFGPDRSAIRQAAGASQTLRTVGLHWTRIANAIRGSSIEAAIPDDVGLVLAFLAQVERFATAAPADRAGRRPELQKRLDDLLSGRHGLHWAPLVELACKAIPGLMPALSPTNLARLNAHRTASNTVRPLLRWHAGMLCVLFPWLGFRLLAKAPRHLPQLRIPGGRG
jgi:hypothetical protein